VNRVGADDDRVPKRRIEGHVVTTYCEGIVLAALRREGVPLKPSEIAEWEGITPGAARRAMVSLQAKGRVFCNRNGYCELSPNDGSRS
jgi:hypothetical protein